MSMSPDMAIGNAQVDSVAQARSMPMTKKADYGNVRCGETW
jgi:hypothetical protein